MTWPHVVSYLNHNVLYQTKIEILKPRSIKGKLNFESVFFKKLDTLNSNLVIQDKLPEY